MKPISEMNDQEKSAYLITLCDFSQDFMLEHAGLWQAGRAINLYEPLNMALAWRVLNWALRTHINSKDFHQLIDLRNELRDWLSTNSLWGTNFAQRVWLDKILSLAIESGIWEDTAVS